MRELRPIGAHRHISMAELEGVLGAILVNTMTRLVLSLRCIGFLEPPKHFLSRRSIRHLRDRGHDSIRMGLFSYWVTGATAA